MNAIEIKGLAEIPSGDMSPFTEKIARLMFRSVQENFIAGGRPNQWAPLKATGEQSHLYGSGELLSNIQMGWDSRSATVSVDTARVPYAAIHNFGGMIKHPGSDKLQVFQIGGATVFSRGTKPHDIRIPQRQYMMFQEEDIAAIGNMLVGYIFSLEQSTRSTA
jgi:phage gpG-like protein